jgi:uncharacterized protein (DUF433 family)
MSASQIAVKSWIEKTPNVCGGDARIRNTRHTVAALVEWRKLGVTDEKLQSMFDPPLTQADLDAAWEYYRNHGQEIEQSIWENKASMIERSAAPIPVSTLVQARRLGMGDDRIRNAFDPPLSQADLDAFWRHYEQHRDEIDRELEQLEGC